MEIACLSEGAVLWMCSLFVQRQSAAVQVVGYCLALFWSVLCSPVRLAPPQHVDFCVYLPMPMRVMCMGLCAHAREHRVLMSRHAQMHTRTCIICSPRALPTLRIAHFVARLAYCTFDLASCASLALRTTCTFQAACLAHCAPIALYICCVTFVALRASLAWRVAPRALCIPRLCTSRIARLAQCSLAPCTHRALHA